MIILNRPRFPAGRPELCKYTVPSSRLPHNFDGFKIAHISDPHSVPASGVSAIIAGERPDITVITGDLVHDDDKDTQKISALLSELVSISPVYIITGNHDVWRVDRKKIFQEFENIGAVLLDSRRIIFERNGEHIALFGVGDPFSKLPEEISSVLRRDFSALPEFDGFKILLFHRANLFDEIKNFGYDLILSGHMHGGQIRIPHLGGVLAPSSALLSGKRMLFPKYSAGEVHFGDTVMIINRGIGNTLPLPRLANRPEVGIITLKSTQ